MLRTSPRARFVRVRSIEEVIAAVENFVPFALIGVGGIGKTFVALTVLHHIDFSTVMGSQLSQLSVRGHRCRSRKCRIYRPIPEFLLSRNTLLILDGAETILDPQANGSEGPYS